MKIIKTPSAMQKFSKSHHDKTIGFVPTMGALHGGHSSLIRQAKRECDLTVVSIYINETQFNDCEDLKNYPVSIEEDLSLLRELAVDLVFIPDFKGIYPDNYRYQVVESQHSLDLCGAHRPGHFNAVLTVVMKLLNIVGPAKAYFGEKDFQQLHLVRDMASSFFMNCQIIGCPTMRDSRGLALSSRNRKLSGEELNKARLFAKMLKAESNLSTLRRKLSSHGIDVDYLVEKDGRRFAAVKISNVRLIDNVPS